MITAIVTIVMFLVMISLHEFGHFISGKLLGFRVLEFAIGFGPTLWKKQKGETLYSIRIIPFGGFCKFDGEDEDSSDERAFNNQKGWKRLIVLAAGAFLNVVLGFILYMVLISSTSPVYTNVVDQVVDHSYMAQAGIQRGDEIIKINGKNVDFYQDIKLYTQNFQENEQATVTVKRDGKKIETAFQPSKRIIDATYQETGVEYVESLNGYPERSFEPYSDNLPKDDSLIGKTKRTEGYILGFTPQKEEITLLNIVPQSYYMTKFVVKLVYHSVWDMITGKVGMDQLSGPVGVVGEVNNAVNSGPQSWIYVLNLVALLTINLGIFNLLPLPALDGGRLIFVIIEMIRRKPVPRDKEGMVHAIGLLLLFALMIFVSFHDILKLFGKG